MGTGFSKNKQYQILTENGWEDFDGVTRTLNANRDALTITTNSGKSVTCTTDHKVVSGSNKIEAQHLTLGDEINIEGKDKEKIVSIIPNTIDHTYDIFNSESHTILANDLSVVQCDELAFVSKRIAINFWTSVFPTLSCLTGDTWVLSDKGYRQIKDYFTEDHKAGDYFLMDGEKTWGKNGIEDISHGYVSPASKTYIIETRSGHRLEVTEDHPLYALVDGSEGMVQSKKLRVGNHLRCDLGMNVYGSVSLDSNLSFLQGTEFATHQSSIPNDILKGTQDTQRSFLRGLYQASGKGDNKLSLGSVDALRLVKMILANMGIRSSIIGNTLVSDSLFDVPEYGPMYFWDDIISIEESYQDVTYDFTVPDTHSFLQNGVLGSNTGGSCIITSTPTDDETLFADIWKKANDCLDEFGNATDVGSNGFKAVKVKWDEHPERGEEFKELMIKQFGEEKFRREHELDFIAEDETLISPLVLSELKSIEPIQKTGEVRWYKELDREKIYLIGYDPSLGTGGDNSAIQIFEFPTMEQVGEWMHNKSDIPTQLNVLKKILGLFEKAGFDEDNVRWTLENNAIGEAPLVLIDEYGEDEFFGFFMSEPYNPLDAKKRRRFRKGYNTNGSSKLTACTRMKRWIEQGTMKVNSKPLIKELKGFVSRGRTYKARAGDNDDLVMAMMLVVRMAMVTMDEEDEFMDALGVNRDMDDEDDLDDWDQPLPVIF